MAGVELIRFGMVINGTRRKIELAKIGRASFTDQFPLALERGYRPAPLLLIDEAMMNGAIPKASWTGNVRVNGPFTKGEGARAISGGLVLQAEDIARTGAPYGRGDVSIIVYLSALNTTEQTTIMVPDFRLTRVATNLASGCNGGKVDPVTRLPVIVPKEVFGALPENKKRWFYGIDGPLSRCGPYPDDQRGVIAYGGSNFYPLVLGVQPYVLDMLAEERTARVGFPEQKSA